MKMPIKLAPDPPRYLDTSLLLMSVEVRSLKVNLRKWALAKELS